MTQDGVAHMKVENSKNPTPHIGFHPIRVQLIRVVSLASQGDCATTVGCFTALAKAATGGYLQGAQGGRAGGDGV